MIDEFDRGLFAPCNPCRESAVNSAISSDVGNDRDRGKKLITNYNVRII